MKHIDAQTVRERIDLLRQWRGRADPDAKLMAAMLVEIDRLRVKDAKRLSDPGDA